MPPRPAHLIFAVLGIALALGARDTPALDTITVDAATVVSDTSRHQLGTSISFLMGSDRARRAVPPRTTQAALQDMGTRFLRFPGGEESSVYLWSTPPWSRPRPTLARTGPYEWPANSRQYTASDDGTWIPGKEPLDFDEFMTMSRAVGAEPVIVLAYDSMYKAPTPGGTRPTREQLLTTAVEWVRYANVFMGYGVKYWTLGNETDYFTDGNPGPAQYAADLKEFSRRMKAIDPGILIGAQSGATATWLQTVLGSAAADIDFVDVHGYPNHDWSSGYEDFRTGNLSFTVFADRAIGVIDAYAPAADRDRLKVVVSEFAAHDFSLAWPDRNDTGHALVLFDMVGQMLRRPDIDFMLFASTHLFTNNAIEAPIGTTNLLANPGFEDDLAGWPALLGASSATATSDPDHVHGGARALAMVGIAEEAQAQAVTGALLPASVYTLSFWADYAGIGGTAGCGIDFFQNGAKVGSKIIPIFDKGEYRHYGIPFLTPAAFDQAAVWVYKPGSDPLLPGDALYFDDVSVTTGGAASDLEAIGPDNRLLATGRTIAIWNAFLLDQLVAATGTPMVIAYASRATATPELNVFLLNKDTTARVATVELSNHAGATSAARWTFKGSTPDDLLPTWEQGAAVRVDGDRMTLELEALSVTVLRLGAPPPADNYQGMWWASPAGSESGWGINFAHQGDTIFATWFTFGLDGKPLWLVAAAERTAPRVYSGRLFTGTGPAFNAVPFDPAKVVPTDVGAATFTFADDGTASFAYTVDGVSQTKTITREQFGPRCRPAAGARSPTSASRPTSRTCGGPRRQVPSPAGASTSRTRATRSSPPGSPTASTASRCGWWWARP